MTDKIIDFERQRHTHSHKRKEARVDALRRAFRLARNEETAGTSAPGRKRRRKSRKK